MRGGQLDLEQYPVDAIDQNGRRVRCHRSWFREHILLPRPFFIGMIPDLNAAIADPDFVTELAHSRPRQAHYRRASWPYERELCKVIVEGLVKAASGKVITAFLVTDMPPPERSKVIYRKASS